MHYVLPLRYVAKSHITTHCSKEYCLLCELGFVMRMLEDAKGINCQATNFCKTIPNLPSGKPCIESRIGLMDISCNIRGN
jgi:hypothetical protein